MKSAFAALSLILISCVSVSLNTRTQIENLSLEVYKIDSINSWYLIYARRNDSLFKIVSNKHDSISYQDAERILLYHFYKFKIESTTDHRKINGHEVLPQQNINCFAYDLETRICFEGDSIRSLYMASNIKGLYFIK